MDDKLIKVVRTGEEGHNVPVPTASTNEESDDEDDDEEEMEEGFTRQVLSGVRFANLLRQPALSTTIPAQVWSPEAHQYFPDAFQKASLELMMCSNSEYLQPPPPQPKPEERINIAAMLPKSLWIEVLSFTHRRCECQP